MSSTEHDHYAIKILRDGTWLHDGRPITRHNMVKLFASVLSRDDQGRYWLITPHEHGMIEIEDAPFVAVELREKGNDLMFRTNVDDWVTLGPDHPLRLENGVPYVRVRGGLEARILRPVYYDLVARCLPDPTGGDDVGIISCGVFFPLGKP